MLRDVGPARPRGNGPGRGAGYVQRAGARTLGATLYYRIDRDSVTDVAKPLGCGVILLTKANLARSQSAGLEFNANGKLTPKLSYGISGEAFYSQIDATALGAPGLKGTTGLNLKANLDYRPTVGDTLQISLSRTDQRLTPQGSVAAIDLVNLGYRRQLRSDLALVLTVSDLFDGQRLRRFTNAPDLLLGAIRMRRERTQNLDASLAGIRQARPWGGQRFSTLDPATSHLIAGG